MSISIPRAGSTSTGEPDQPTWGLPDALGGYVVAYVFASITGALVLGAGGFRSRDEIDGAPLTWTMGAAVFIWIAFIAIAVWVAAAKGNGWRRDYRVAIRPVDVPVGIAAGVIAQFVLVNAIAWPILKISGKTAEDLARPAQELADKAHGAGGALLFIFVVCVLAPVAEELFFRGSSTGRPRSAGTRGGRCCSRAPSSH
ncbi:hypothetical protein ACE2AJ_17740 [Aquihabitans daechungensis]|uniref:hypothetical protein n=1 Tax=Aquihabitans daechungensis TaxID=1052257 RepID=UPI003BA0B851